LAIVHIGEWHVDLALTRFRPNLPGTGAGSGIQDPGSGIRQPLGIPIVDVLAMFQLFTHFTTPIVYLAMNQLRVRFVGPQALPLTRVTQGATHAYPSDDSYRSSGECRLGRTSRHQRADAQQGWRRLHPRPSLMADDWPISGYHAPLDPIAMDNGSCDLRLLTAKVSGCIQNAALYTRRVQPPAEAEQ
jgi:hypothetical protein